MSGETQISNTKYGELLSRTLPHVIHNDKQLEHFTDVLLELDDIDQQTPEQKELAELLTTLIQKYEAEKYPLRRATPIETIQFLMDQRGIAQKDLAQLFGSKGNISEILSGKRNIAIRTAIKLAEFFQVPPELFIEFRAVASGAAGD